MEFLRRKIGEKMAGFLQDGSLRSHINICNQIMQKILAIFEQAVLANALGCTYSSQKAIHAKGLGEKNGI
jgi:hypothetical protein